MIDYVIPGNDDAIRSGALLCRLIADAVTEGRFIRAHRPAAARAAAAPAPIVAPVETESAAPAKPEPAAPAKSEPAAPDPAQVETAPAVAAL